MRWEGGRADFPLAPSAVLTGSSQAPGQREWKELRRRRISPAQGQLFSGIEVGVSVLPLLLNDLQGQEFPDSPGGSFPLTESPCWSHHLLRKSGPYLEHLPGSQCRLMRKDAKLYLVYSRGPCCL